jgi:cytochrome c oxidase assembly factor CtaG
VVVVAAAAVPVALVAALASGALDPVLLGDSGPVTRYGIVITRALHDVSAALGVGLLLVAAFLTPESRTSVRRETAARAAAGAAVVWTVTAAAGLVLAFADAAGMPVSSPGFWSLLLENVVPLELTRLLLIETGLALLLVPAAWVARTRGALAWTFLLSLAALVPLSLSGHASGTEGHEQAMTALMFHLVGISLWVGGLLAIVLLRRHLGRALEVTVRRYSTIALWCYVAVAGSGVLFALVQVEEVADLVSPYWLLIWAKVAALVVLGGFGYVQRRRVLAGGLDRPGAFARLALTELAVMGATVGLAVALSRTPPPVEQSASGDRVLELTGYPAPPPLEASSWLTVWQVNWLFLPAAVLAVALYLAGVRRLRARGDHWPVGRTICWVLGWAVFVYATNGAPGVYGRVMFSMHMVMHMALMMFIPILLVPGAAITLALRALRPRRDRTLGPREVVLAVVHSRWASIVANPVVAAVIFFGSLVAFYWTGLFEWALTSHEGHVFMVVHFTLSGFAFVWSLVGTDPGPRKWPPPLRLVVLFATLALHAFFGLSIMTGTWLLAPGFFKAIDLPYVPDLLADQQLGGTIAWGIGEMPTLALALMVAVSWARSDQREARRSDRRADRDGDAELAAYNARLAALAARDPARKEQP